MIVVQEKVILEMEIQQNLPEPDNKGKIPSMKFTNFKNKLERPYIVYADMESTLVKTDHKKNIHEHVPKSCSLYFACTYDSTQNVFWNDVSINCVENMIKGVKQISFYMYSKDETQRRDGNE